MHGQNDLPVDGHADCIDYSWLTVRHHSLLVNDFDLLNIGQDFYQGHCTEEMLGNSSYLEKNHLFLKIRR